MTLLTPHFTREELELDSPMPDNCIPAYTKLCELVLEPIRAHFGGHPMEITSGYRSPAVNAADHGSTKSEHIATPEWCAADFKIVSLGKNLRDIFDWIRSQPSSVLPFHQVILEHGLTEDIIHISWNVLSRGRQALEGAEYNQSPYISWGIVE